MVTIHYTQGPTDSTKGGSSCCATRPGTPYCDEKGPVHRYPSLSKEEQQRPSTLPPETTRQPDPTDPSCSLVIREPVANRVSFDPSAAIIPPLPSDSGTDQPQPTGTSIPDAWHGDSAYEDDAATTAYWKHQYNLRGEIIASQQHRIDRHWDELRRYESALQASESRVSQLDHALQQSEQDREEGRWGLEETLARLAHVDAELRAAHAFSEFVQSTMRSVVDTIMREAKEGMRQAEHILLEQEHDADDASTGKRMKDEVPIHSAKLDVHRSSEFRNQSVWSKDRACTS